MQQTILLPQKDPDFCDFCLRSLNVPKLAKEKIKANGRKMSKTIGSEAKNVTFELKAESLCQRPI
jgi:hypothetical protein